MSDTLNTPPTYAWVWNAFSKKLAGTVTKPTLNPPNNVYVEEVNPEDEENKIPEDSLRPMDALTPTKQKNGQNGILKTPGTLQIKKSVNFKDHLGDDSLNRELQSKKYEKEDIENNRRHKSRFSDDFDYDFEDKYFSQPSSKQLAYKLSRVAKMEGKNENFINSRQKEVHRFPLKHGKQEEARSVDGHGLLRDQGNLKFNMESKKTLHTTEAKMPKPESSDTKEENSEWSKLIKDCFRDVVNNNRKMKNIIHDVLVDTSHLVNSTEIPDEVDYTINLDDPMSSSGKYWKQKFGLLETAHSDLEEELSKIRERVDAIMMERQEEISFWKRRCKLLEAENDRISRLQRNHELKFSEPQTYIDPKPKDNYSITNDLEIPQRENSLFQPNVPERTTKSRKPSNITFSNPLDMSYLAAEMLSHSAKKKQSNDSFFNFGDGAGPISSTPVSAASKVRQRLLHATQTPTPVPVTNRRKEPQIKPSEIEDSFMPPMGLLSKNHELADRQLAHQKEPVNTDFLRGAPSMRNRQKFTLTEILPYEQELQPKTSSKATELTAEQKLSKERSAKARIRLEERRQKRGIA
ncbi:spindle pole body protein Cut12 [Schizosaccharomyces octosporus yFS286]|uniref:Spindle pole body protein Cut12 n=1 Tax=Schizosaccharomyces octosporus (strain yFS286) TaxID=483514 RepID=S9PUB5_SCHOY|nr:spindle pole body protein Cut12 [Schizosaccharomyces octosporus yFS286]EPX71547.1 spindle pole body protein Cut12 [Schizosaccharomyces octosporus yFS286]